MANVCVITGGGSGMGFEAAKVMGQNNKIIVLSGRTEAKLEKSVKELEDLGITAYAKACDNSKRESVQELVAFASALGEIKNVINCGGVSPAMAEAETILRINALGTIYINQEFYKAMKPGSVIVDVASNSAYNLPPELIFKEVYALADTDEEQFVQTLLEKSGAAPEMFSKDIWVYMMSKNFVIWYASKCAFEYGRKGIRVCSISPGLIATPMGNLEKESGAMLIPSTAEERMGKPEELGFAIAMVADERNGYLAGVDVLCDGGSVRGMQEFKKL